MRTLALVLGLLIAAPASGGEVETCIATNVTISAENVGIDRDAVGFDLSIANDLSIDLSGVIVKFELWAEGRPTPLRDGYSGAAHLLGGALLSGETTTFREYIGLYPREFELAKSAQKLRIDLVVENVADLDQNRLATAEDPFRMWSNTISNQSCEGRSG